MKRFVILISGGGSNMEAILRAAKGQPWGDKARFTGVISNRADAGGLEKAARFGVPTAVVLSKVEGQTREAFEEKLAAQIDYFGADFVLLAGFMRVLTEGFVKRYSERLVNIHPSLLPSFPGLHTHERALAFGAKIHGATVHWVSPTLDHGAVIAQVAVPVLVGDTAASLAARVLTLEHQIYPQVVQWLCEDRLRLEPLVSPVDPQRFPEGQLALCHAANARQAVFFTE